MSAALETWKRKLDDFQQQEAIAADPAIKFNLAELIKEAKAKIAELEKGTDRQHTSVLPPDTARILRYAPES